MSRTPPSLTSVNRAYAAGRCSALRTPSPLQRHRLGLQLAQASPEVAAAYAAGVAADPSGPLPLPQAVLGLVVQRLAREAAP